jgi:hypothetical protein
LFLYVGYSAGTEPNCQFKSYRKIAAVIKKAEPEKRGRGRPKLAEGEPQSSVLTRMPTALLARIKAAAGTMTVAAFIRSAIERELSRRERKG